MPFGINLSELLRAGTDSGLGFIAGREARRQREVEQAEKTRQQSLADELLRAQIGATEALARQRAPTPSLFSEDETRGYLRQLLTGDVGLPEAVSRLRAAHPGRVSEGLAFDVGAGIQDEARERTREQEAVQERLTSLRTAGVPETDAVVIANDPVAYREWYSRTNRTTDDSGDAVLQRQRALAAAAALRDVERERSEIVFRPGTDMHTREMNALNQRARSVLTLYGYETLQELQDDLRRFGVSEADEASYEAISEEDPVTAYRRRYGG